MSLPQNNLPLSPLTQNLCPRDPFCLCLKWAIDYEVKLMMAMIIFTMEVMIIEGGVKIEMISMITLLTIVLIADYFDDYLPREAIARRKRRSAEGARFATHRRHQTLVRNLE